MEASFWDRYARARIARRTVLRASAAAAAGAGAVAIAGCGDGAKSGGATPTAAPRAADRPDILNAASPPQYGGVLKTANSANFGSFDPHTGVAVASAYFPRIYNMLVNQSATKPEYTYLDLAQSYEVPDDSTYIFKVRPGVKVAPNDLGVPERDLDAEDVKANLERMKTDAATNQYGFASQYIESASAAGDTVTVKTPGAYAWFINRMSLYFGAIAPRELLAGDLARLAGKTAGAGAFRLRSVTEGEAARFDRNPNYYRKDEANGGMQLPYVDGLQVSVVLDRATQRAAFLSGQIHTYWTQGGEEARGLSDVAISREPNFAYISITMNPQRKPFDDARARRAVSRAIDRDEYVRIIYNGDAQPDGLVHWPLGSYALGPDELRTAYQPFDVADAKKLVAAAGGVRLKLTYPASTSIEEHGQHLPIFKQQMQQAGIEVEDDPLDFGTWIERYRGLKYDSSLALNQVYETPELPLAFHTTGGPFGDKSYIQGLGDPEIDAAVKKANTALDLDARRRAVLDAQRLIYAKDPMFLPLVTPYMYWAYSNKLHNIPTGIGTTQYSLSDFWLES